MREPFEIAIDPAADRLQRVGYGRFGRAGALQELDALFVGARLGFTEKVVAVFDIREQIIIDQPGQIRRIGSYDLPGIIDLRIEPQNFVGILDLIEYPDLFIQRVRNLLDRKSVV